MPHQSFYTREWAIPAKRLCTCMCVDVQEKTLEPWILHTFDGDFYGEEIRLVVAAYIRAEANFESLQVCEACGRASVDGGQKPCP
jgi:hypothetical protein